MNYFWCPYCKELIPVPMYSKHKDEIHMLEPFPSLDKLRGEE